MNKREENSFVNPKQKKKISTINLKNINLFSILLSVRKRHKLKLIINIHLDECWACVCVCVCHLISEIFIYLNTHTRPRVLEPRNRFTHQTLAHTHDTRHTTNNSIYILLQSNINVNVNFFRVCLTACICLRQNHASLIGSNDSKIFHFHCFVLFYLLYYYELQHIYGPVSYIRWTIKMTMWYHIGMKNMHTNISRFYWCVNRWIVWSLIGIVWLNHLSSFLIYDLEKSCPKNVTVILLIYSREHTRKKSSLAQQASEQHFMYAKEQPRLFRNQAFFLRKNSNPTNNDLLLNFLMMGVIDSGR